MDADVGRGGSEAQGVGTSAQMRAEGDSDKAHKVWPGVAPIKLAGG